MRVSHTPLFFAVFTLLVCSAPLRVQAQPIEYGASAGAWVTQGEDSDGPYSQQNLEGTAAAVHAEWDDVFAHARVGIDSVSCLSEIIDAPDSNASTYDTFFWDTFRVTSASIPNGTLTTVTFSVGVDAILVASSNDQDVTEYDVESLMLVGVRDATLTDGVPAELGLDHFRGVATLDADSGLLATDDLFAAPFNVEATSGGYSATLSGFAVPIDIPATVGSEFSLKFYVETGASVAAGLTDGIARADLRNSLRILAIETEEGIELRRASGALIPPVPLHVTPVLVTVLPGVGLARLARRSSTAT